MSRVKKLLCMFASAAVLLTNTAVYAEEEEYGDEEIQEISDSEEAPEDNENTADEEIVINQETDPEVAEEEPPDITGDEKNSEETPETQEPVILPSLSYQTHLSNYGWSEQFDAGEPAIEGRIEALRIESENLDGSIVCQTHVSNLGWMAEVEEGMIAGTTGQSRQVEAFKIRIEGNDAQSFNIYYRAMITSFGWTDWAANGSPCGSEGYSLALRSIEIRIVRKDSGELSEGKSFFQMTPLSVRAHVANIGWQKAVGSGSVAGTTGQSKRMEALLIELPDEMKKLGNIQAYAHVQDIGWQNPVSSGELIGTTGRSKRLEAVRIELTGQLTDMYNVYYRTHVHNVGWLGYAKNGETAGSVGYGLAIEAVQIILEEKDGLYSTGNIDQSVSALHYKKIQYTAHVANEGWKTVTKAPSAAGTIGKNHPIEALTVTLPEDLMELGDISVEAHVQNKGWLTPVHSGQIAGTTGQALQMEGIRLTLTGELADKYDIYYRAYVRGLGWLGWTRNGGLAGSEGCSRWIEGIQIDLVNKEYKKYSLGTSYTILKLSGYSSLISVLDAKMGKGVTGFGSATLSTGLQSALLNEAKAIENSGYSIGFVMIDIISGKGVAYNPDQKLYSASSVKGLYIGALTSQNRDAYNNDSRIMREILRTSSDALYHQLFNKYGYTYLRRWCDQTNIESHVATNMYSNYSAKDMAKLWVKMYEFFSSGNYGNEIGTWYQNPNRSPIREQLGGRFLTRTKAGWIGEPGYNCSADGGIIYAASGSYIITMISNMPAKLERLYGIVELLNTAHNEV